MAGNTTRNKGRKGETEAKRLLQDRDYTILADTTGGLSTGDLVVQSPEGVVYDVEVKNRKLIDVPQFVGQARKNATRSKVAWMALAKIDGTSSWLCMAKNRLPVVWHAKTQGELDGLRNDQPV